MPLAFNSLSHGEIAFGFFNAETDLLILDRYFVFASDFCAEIAEIAGQAADRPIRREWSVYALKNEDIGNLTAAIHRIDLRGFIGDVYSLFPFPADTHEFAQNPESDKTRGVVTETIERYCRPSTITFAVDAAGSTVEIGDYMFSREEFHELLKCVWIGGYPNWKHGIRPDYVTGMMESIAASHHPLFKGMTSFI
jgi:hypothetical protein